MSLRINVLPLVLLSASGCFVDSLGQGTATGGTAGAGGSHNGAGDTASGAKAGAGGRGGTSGTAATGGTTSGAAGTGAKSGTGAISGAGGTGAKASGGGGTGAKAGAGGTAGSGVGATGTGAAGASATGGAAGTGGRQGNTGGVGGVSGGGTSGVGGTLGSGGATGGGCKGPNALGCRSTGCGPGFVCDTSGASGCASTACSCDAATSHWICTPDCSGGVCIKDAGGCAVPVKDPAHPIISVTTIPVPSGCTASGGSFAPLPSLTFPQIIRDAATFRTRLNCAATTDLPIDFERFAAVPAVHRGFSDWKLQWTSLSGTTIHFQYAESPYCEGARPTDTVTEILLIPASATEAEAKNCNVASCSTWPPAA